MQNKNNNYPLRAAFRNWGAVLLAAACLGLSGMVLAQTGAVASNGTPPAPNPPKLSPTPFF